MQEASGVLDFQTMGVGFENNDLSGREKKTRYVQYPMVENAVQVMEYAYEGSNFAARKHCISSAFWHAGVVSRKKGPFF